MAEFLGRHLTPAELAHAWGLDETTIRRIFLDLPGVLKIGRTIAGKKKRSYVTLRIPEEVARQVYQERTK
ncbi:MAG TPA: hypothetical protein VG096_20455 [Bryobacteraceae bacterium]|jgi:hypothetical protein|nr:hypothetical protein [Bryobacteraceae bacterium]